MIQCRVFKTKNFGGNSCVGSRLRRRAASGGPLFSRTKIGGNQKITTDSKNEIHDPPSTLCTPQYSTTIPAAISLPGVTLGGEHVSGADYNATKTQIAEISHTRFETHLKIIWKSEHQNTLQTKLRKYICKYNTTNPHTDWMTKHPDIFWFFL